jgi:hypothetical protein
MLDADLGLPTLHEENTEDEPMHAGSDGRQADVASPVEIPEGLQLPEGPSLPLLETQAGETQTQPLTDSITEATAAVYDALQQLHTEQARQDPQATQQGTTLSLEDCVESLSRAEAARVFYQLLGAQILGSCGTCMRVDAQIAAEWLQNQKREAIKHHTLHARSTSHHVVTCLARRVCDDNLMQHLCMQFFKTTP